MIGTLVNVGAVVIGGTIGLMLNKSMPDRFKTIYFQAIGLFTLSMGIGMVWNMERILLVVGCLAVGSLLGEWANIELSADKLGSYLKKRFRIANENFTEGLVTAFLLYCVGSMTILGAIQEGTGTSSDLLFTKSLMDGFSSILLASAFGVGVIFSALPLFIFQGALTLLATYASSFFTPEIIKGITSVGGILLIGLGLNILGVTKIRVMNMLPAIILIALVLYFF